MKVANDLFKQSISKIMISTLILHSLTRQKIEKMIGLISVFLERCKMSSDFRIKLVNFGEENGFEK